MTKITGSVQNIYEIEDGEDCTDLICGDEREVPLSWALQDDDVAARMLIHTVLRYDGIPMEGSICREGHCWLAFYTEIGGFGYTMTYECGEEDDLGFTKLENVRVLRSSQYDRGPNDTFVPFEIALHPFEQ